MLSGVSIKTRKAWQGKSITLIWDDVFIFIPVSPSLHLFSQLLPSMADDIDYRSDCGKPFKTHSSTHTKPYCQSAKFLLSSLRCPILSSGTNLLRELSKRLRVTGNELRWELVARYEMTCMVGCNPGFRCTEAGNYLGGGGEQPSNAKARRCVVRQHSVDACL